MEKAIVRLTFALGCFESLHFSLLFPGWNTKGETSLADICRCWLGNDRDKAVENSRGSRCSGSLNPLPSIAEATITSSFLEILILILAV